MSIIDLLSDVEARYMLAYCFVGLVLWTLLLILYFRIKE
jgi:hypothetical protein